MQCFSCKYPDSHVVYTRSDETKKRIERRRECLRCGLRFTTHEKLKEAKRPNDDRFPTGNRS
jgi:transcriptional repressor NrdR